MVTKPVVADRVLSEEVKGVDTIRGLVGSPPMIIHVPREVVKSENSLQRVWNSRHIAIIPYCFVCKEPLTWVSPPDKDGRIFKCSKCGRVWVSAD